MSEPILTLSTLAPERRHIVIDGIKYEIKAMDEFSVREIADIQSLSAKIYGAASKIATATEADLAQYGRDLDAFVVKLVPGLAHGFLARMFSRLKLDALSRMKPKHKQAIINAFTLSALPARPRDQAENDSMKLTSDSSVPGSNASTAETPSAGTPSPLDSSPPTPPPSGA